ncbi:unnamed protein product [Bursaphelenchus okinawaensis]|uniref:Uncharacterized protein n=1 Tax=Bursaphelenchus okinawaensis TaxID=465554 RepID=A0A811K6W1_9BILA|nr:unnamed protein product [Bursaphelenchus okinawaensis]CAG9092931.1 unnamed protein product [Bursaphelenchus okinawaensis]
MDDDQPLDTFNPEPYSFVITERRRKKPRKRNHGFFRQAVPCLPFPLAVVCCTLNVIFPGFGTIFAGCMLLLSPLIIGYVWSIMWGVLFIQISRRWWISRLEDRENLIENCPCSSW